MGSPEPSSMYTTDCPHPGSAPSPVTLEMSAGLVWCLPTAGQAPREPPPCPLRQPQLGPVPKESTRRALSPKPCVSCGGPTLTAGTEEPCRPLWSLDRSPSPQDVGPQGHGQSGLVPSPHPGPAALPAPQPTTGLEARPRRHLDQDGPGMLGAIGGWLPTNQKWWGAGLG